MNVLERAYQGRSGQRPPCRRAHPGHHPEVAVGIGAKVAKGDKLLTMEAMKMQTTVYAAADGVVDKINVGIGESVESKDLIMELREA